MAIGILDKTVEARLIEIGESMPVPVKRQPLATQILKVVVTAKSMADITSFVRDLRPELARKERSEAA